MVRKNAGVGELNGLNLLDFLALAILLVSIVAATIKGIAGEIIALSSVVVGVFSAAFYYPDCAALVSRLGVSSPYAEFLGFVSLIVVAIVVGGLLTRFVDKTLKALRLKWIDRLLGAAFGFLRGFLINAALFLAFAAFPVGGDLLGSSRTGPVFLAGASVLTRLVPRELREKFENGYRSVYETWTKAPAEAETAPREADHPGSPGTPDR